MAMLDQEIGQIVPIEGVVGALPNFGLGVHSEAV